jgi:hypothetical protein
MVRSGWALDFGRYSGGHYAAEQLETEQAQRGLWSGSFVNGLTAPWPARSLPRTEREHAAVDHRSFRDQLAFSIGFAVSQSRDLLRRLLKEHLADDARQQLAERVIDHLEQCGFEIDEAEQVMRKRPLPPKHG